MCGAGCGRFLGLVLSLAGLGLSLYALHVETQASKDGDYVALCDLSDLMSCSKVLTSPYSRGFGLVSKYLGGDHPANQPNSVYGIMFYSFMLLLAFINRRFIASLQVFLSFVACSVSCYLGYILYFVLKDLCVVCVSTYAVNFLLLLVSYCKRRSLSSSGPKPDKYGYYIPTSNPSSSNNNFKKFI